MFYLDYKIYSLAAVADLHRTIIFAGLYVPLVVGRMKGLVLLFILAAVSLASAQMRNESDLDVLKRCVKLGVQIDCAMPNVTLQEKLQIATECDDNGVFANAVANSCTRNVERGIFCGEVNYYSVDIAAISVGACATAIVGGNCSSECKMSLQTLRNDLGCCITNMLNNTIAPRQPIFSYSLWSRCKVNVVEDACPGQLPYVLNPRRNCTYQDDFLQLDCEDARNPRIRQQTDCEIFFDFLDDFCSLDERGNFCLETDPVTDIKDYIVPLIQANCLTDSKTCLANSNCRNIFEQFVGARGCCINAIYNSTFGRIFGFNQPIFANGTLFSLCRLQTPSSTCRVFIGSGSLKLEGLTFLLLIPLIIISLTVN